MSATGDIKNDASHIEHHAESQGVGRQNHLHHITSIDQGNEAVLLDVGASGAEGNLRLAKNGHTVLIPQPTGDPQDPLNWSWKKKHAILFIVGLSAFLGDFGSGAGIPCIVLQGAEWDMSPNSVNYAGNLNVIMLGIGGLLYIPLIYVWGRAPVLFWTTLAGTFFTLACCLAQSFDVFYAFRALMGVTLTACQTIGLSFIKDMFFFHEHARKIGIWAAMFLLAPYFAPLLGNFIIGGTGEWRPVFWMVFGVCCLDLVLIVLFADETWYRRDVEAEKQPPRGSRLMRLVGVWQIGQRGYFMTFGQSLRRYSAVLIKPIIIPALFYYALSFMWAVGINITSSILIETPVADGGYGFSANGTGYLYFTPVVAVLLGELFGHFFNDFLAARYVSRHAGVFKPEARLWTNYIATFFMIPGLILVGQALEHHLSYAAIVMGWGMYVFGVMCASVAITAYALDSYPTAAGEVSAFLNFARTVGGFAVGYFQQPWGKRDGYATSFGIQAVFVAVAVAILVVLHVFGPRMREKGGMLKY